MFTPTMYSSSHFHTQNTQTTRIIEFTFGAV